MKLVDPTVATPVRESRRASALTSMDGLTIGLLSNGKLNADVLLEEDGPDPSGPDSAAACCPWWRKAVPERPRRRIC